MSSHPFLGFTGFLNMVTSLVLGGLVLADHPRRPVNRSFFLFNVAVACYSLGYWAWQRSSSPEQATPWFTFLFIGIVVINAFYIHFVFTFLDVPPNQWKIFWMKCLMDLFFVGLALNSQIFHALEPRRGLGYWPFPTIFFHVFLVYWHLTCFYGFALMLKAWHGSVGIRREQLKFVSLAFAIGYVGGATNWPMWYDIPLTPYANILISVYISIMAYAVARLHLWDMNLALRRLAVRFLFVLIFGCPCVGLLYLMPSHLLSVCLVLGAIAVSPSLFQLWESRFTDWIDRLPFFRGRYERLKFLPALTEGMFGVSSVEQWAEHLAESLRRVLEVDRVAVLLYDDSAKAFRPKAALGFDETERWFITVPLDGVVARALKVSRWALALPPGSTETEPSAIEITRELEIWQTRMAASLRLGEELVGLVLLGKRLRRQGGEFSAQELDLPGLKADMDIPIMVTPPQSAIFDFLREKCRWQGKEMLDASDDEVLRGINSLLISRDLWKKLKPNESCLELETRGLLAKARAPLGLLSPSEVRRLNKNLLSSVFPGRIHRDGERVFHDEDCRAVDQLCRSAEHALRSVMAAVDSKTQLSGWVHDLLHPFGPKGSFRYLREMGKDPQGLFSKEFKEKLRALASDAEFVGEQLEWLLKGGSKKFDFKVQSLAPLFDREHAKNEALAREAKVQWLVQFPPPSVQVRMDAEMMEHRVLDNLFGNAWRYVPEGGQVELGHELKNGDVILKVKNTGSGISPERLGGLFAKGVQGKESNRGLAGLGLANAKEVVESHGGKIWAESDGRSWTTFCVSLPLARDLGSPPAT